jgi:hypothetical protein
LALRQDGQHFAPDIAGRADHGDLVSHLSVLKLGRGNFPPVRGGTDTKKGALLKEAC